MSRTITVKGIGKVSAKPDYIVLSLTLMTKEQKYEATMSTAASQLESLRDAMTAVGYQRDDLKTTRFGIEPSFESDKDKNGNYKRRFVGYECHHGLKLEFDFDMEILSKTLFAFTKCIAEPEFSIQFSVKDKEAVNTALLQNAAENARKKAEVLCAASSVSLGELLSIDYNWGELNIYSQTKYEMSDACLSVSPCSIDIAPDDIDVSDTVAFVWGIV